MKNSWKTVQKILTLYFYVLLKDKSVNVTVCYFADKLESWKKTASQGKVSENENFKRIATLLNILWVQS